MMLKQLVQTISHRQEGQMLVEYLLLLSMLVGLVILTISLYVGPLGNIYADIKDAFDVILGGADL